MSLIFTIEVLDMMCYPPEDTNNDRGDSRVTYNYRLVITAETTIFQSCRAVPQEKGHSKRNIG